MPWAWRAFIFVRHKLGQPTRVSICVVSRRRLLSALLVAATNDLKRRTLEHNENKGRDRPRAVGRQKQTTKIPSRMH